MEQSPPPRLGVWLAFAFLYVLWGSTYLAIRIGVRNWPPFLFAGTRFVIAGLVPMLVLRAHGTPWPSRRQWRNALVVGVCLSLGGNGLVTWAEQTVSSGVAALLIAITPMWFVLIDGLRPGGRVPRGRTLLGLLIGFSGVVYLLGPADLRAELGSPPLISLLVIVLASLLWAGGSLYGKHAEQPSSTWMWSAAQMLCGGVALVVIGLLAGETSRLSARSLEPSALGAIAYLIVFGSWLGFGSYVWLLQRVSPARLSTYAFVNPIVAVLLGAIVLDEPLTAGLGQAALLILGGVIVVQAPGRAPSRA